MKKAPIKQISLASLAVAVSMALCSNAYTAENSVKETEIKSSSSGSQSAETSTQTAGSKSSADVEENFEIVTKVLEENSEKEKKKKQESPEFVATKIMETMSTDATDEYLKNRKYAEVSLFPAMLIGKLNSKEWNPAPKSPVTGLALSCFYGVPSYKPPVKVNTSVTPVTVTSDKVSGDIEKKDEQKLVYEGNVEIQQGDKHINADKTTYSAKERTLTTDGDAVLSSNEYTVHTSDTTEYNLDERTTKITNARYQFNGSTINGDAEEFHNDEKSGKKVLKKATVSGCPINQRAWHLYSSTVEIQDGDSFGDAWNDVFFIGKVPVFYSPYLNFPITKKRRSGLLPITLEYNSGNGLSYQLPIYLNLAPNLDATVTPGRDSKHGNIYDAQIRYLPFRNFSGQINFTYLPHDPTFTVASTSSSSGTSTTNSNDRKRWFLNLKDKLTFLNNDLVFSLDYSRVREGDYTYTSDISSKNAQVTDSSLVQSLMGSYSQDHYDVSVEFRKYQNMYQSSSSSTFSTYKPFAMLPQVKFSAYDTYGRFTYKFKGEATKFTIEDFIDDDKNVYMSRFHAEPSLKYNAFDSYGTTVDFGATGFLTYYDQYELRYMNSTYKSRLGYQDYQKSVKRALYLLEGKAKTTLERKIWDMNHTQTLEPELKYMYIPYRDQRNIALYDTTTRVSDYYTLFSPYRYAGIDRIANLNTVVGGFTSRILDAHDREMMRFSLAQAFDFVENRVKMTYSDTTPINHRSPLEASFDTVMGDFSFHGQVQYSHQTQKLDQYNTALNYNNKPTGIKLGVSYRFLRNGNYSIKNTSLPKDLEQIGATFNIPLGPNWSIYGASYHDVKQGYNVDTKFGIKYEECCFSIALLYEKYLKWDYTYSKHTPEKFIGLNINFKGLYEVNLRKINDPHGTDTHYIPSLVPNNLNR